MLCWNLFGWGHQQGGVSGWGQYLISLSLVLREELVPFVTSQKAGLHICKASKRKSKEWVWLFYEEFTDRLLIRDMQVSPVRVTALVPPVNHKLSVFSGVQTGQGVPGVCVRGASAGCPAAQPLSVRALRAAEHRAAPPPAAAVAAGLPVQLPGNRRRGPQAKVGGTSHLQGERFERRVSESLNGCSVTSSV